MPLPDVPQATFNQSILHLDVDGSARQALMFSPGAIAQPAKHAVVFFFHGHGGDMTAAAMHAGIHILWPDAIVVYPQGLPTPSFVDPQGGGPGWQNVANQPPAPNGTMIGNRDIH